MNSRTKNTIEEQFVPVLLAIISIWIAWLLVRAARFNEEWQPIIFGVLSVGMLLRQRWLIYSGFIFTILSRLGEPSKGVIVPRVVTDDIFFTIILISYAIFSFRYIDHTKMHSLLEARKRSGLKAAVPWMSLRPILAGLLWLPLATFLAFAILRIFPWDASVDARFRITPSGMRAIGIVWFMFLIWFLYDCVIGLISSRQKDPQRARVYIRSVFCWETGSEFAGIEKRRQRIRNRKRED